MGWGTRVWAAACAAAAVVALTTCLAAAGADSDGDWTTYGDSPARISAVPAEAGALTRHFVLPLDGRVTGQVLYAAGAFYAATTSGEVVSFDPDGYVRWRVDVGQLAHTCAAARRLRRHRHRRRRPGREDALRRRRVRPPARARARDGRRARRLARPRLHRLPTRARLGRARPRRRRRLRADRCVLRLVEPGRRLPCRRRVAAVSRWTSVPSELGGGGGPWGWGGVAFDPDDDQLFAATSGAFAGGSNSGDAFTETAGYGDRLVQLGEDLGVEDSSHPRRPARPARPRLRRLAGRRRSHRLRRARRRGDKNDIVYAWRRGQLAAGPIWELPLETYDPNNPLLSQLAWHASLASLYAVTGTRVRAHPDRRPTARPQIVWRRPLGTRHRERLADDRRRHRLVRGQRRERARRLRRPQRRPRRPGSARRHDARGADHRRPQPRRRHLHRPRRGLQPRAGGAARRRRRPGS